MERSVFSSCECVTALRIQSEPRIRLQIRVCEGFSVQKAHKQWKIWSQTQQIDVNADHCVNLPNSLDHICHTGGPMGQIWPTTTFHVALRAWREYDCLKISVSYFMAYTEIHNFSTSFFCINMKNLWLKHLNSCKMWNLQHFILKVSFLNSLDFFWQICFFTNKIWSFYF